MEYRNYILHLVECGQNMIIQNEQEVYSMTHELFWSLYRFPLLKQELQLPNLPTFIDDKYVLSEVYLLEGWKDPLEHLSPLFSLLEIQMIQVQAMKIMLRMEIQHKH